MNYTGNGQYHDFSAISDIRTVFWVVSQDSLLMAPDIAFYYAVLPSLTFIITIMENSGVAPPTIILNLDTLA